MAVVLVLSQLPQRQRAVLAVLERVVLLSTLQVVPVVPLLIPLLVQMPQAVALVVRLEEPAARVVRHQGRHQGLTPVEVAALVVKVATLLGLLLVQLAAAAAQVVLAQTTPALGASMHWGFYFPAVQTERKELVAVQLLFRVLILLLTHLDHYQVVELPVGPLILGQVLALVEAAYPVRLLEYAAAAGPIPET